MNSIAISYLRGAATASARNAIVRRHVSSACAQSVHKLNDVLEEYRAQNYTQEYPRRFQKEVVQAAAAAANSPELEVPTVSAEGIEHVLQNIGMGHRMSRSEIEGIVSEVGTCPRNDDEKGHCVLSSDQMLDLFSKTWGDSVRDGSDLPRR